MGWSFSVSCKSARAQDEMLTFLNEHYIPTSHLPGIDRDRHRHPRMPSPPGGIKYGGGRLSIGFNDPTDHEQAILRWIAFRVGKKHRFDRKGIPFPVPWVNLDSVDCAPVITRDQWPGTRDTEQYIVDEIGWRGVNRWWEDWCADAELLHKIEGWITQANHNDKVIRSDIERLNNLWLNR